MSSCLIIDGFSLAFRAFYGYPLTLTLPNGQHINAVMGFMTLLLQAVDQFKPTHVLVCFDRPEPTFRDDVYELYKANRSEAPDEFKSQVSLIKDAVSTAGIYAIEQVGYEADDLMGACAIAAKEAGMKETANIKVIIIFNISFIIHSLLCQNAANPFDNFL